MPSSTCETCRACLAALDCQLEGCARVFVTSSDITTSGRTSAQLVETVMPGVEWRGGAEYDEDPFRTLLDIGPALSLLSWSPRHSWRAQQGC